MTGETPYVRGAWAEVLAGGAYELCAHGVDFVAKVLPCGHYTTGRDTPYKFLDGWYLGSFILV
jgi:hypothetical protein